VDARNAFTLRGGRTAVAARVPRTAPEIGRAIREFSRLGVDAPGQAFDSRDSTRGDADGGLASRNTRVHIYLDPMGDAD